MPDDFEKSNKAFERAVTLLQNQLQYLADNDKVSDKFIALQNQVIKALIDYQHTVINYIATLEEENLQLSLGKSKEFERLKALKVRFEAVCLMHGITDLPVWINKSTDMLVSHVLWLHEKKAMQLPAQLRNFIARLPHHEREQLEKILFKGNYAYNDNPVY